jgi:hypothetical protein
VEPNTYSSLHHAVAFLEREACEAWRQEFSLGDDLEYALAQYGSTIEVQYERVTGGFVSVTVLIRGNEERLTRQFWFSLQRAGNRCYKRLEPTPKH